MNPFISHAEMQLIFAFTAKIQLFSMKRIEIHDYLMWGNKTTLIKVMPYKEKGEHSVKYKYKNYVDNVTAATT